MTLVDCDKKYFFLLTIFGHSSLNQMYTCHQTFPFMLFLTFPLKYFLYKKIKFSNKDYLLLIYIFMSMKEYSIFIQSHQILRRFWEWRRIGMDCPEFKFDKKKSLYFLSSLDIEYITTNKYCMSLDHFHFQTLLVRPLKNTF